MIVSFYDCPEDGDSNIISNDDMIVKIPQTLPEAIDFVVSAHANCGLCIEDHEIEEFMENFVNYMGRKWINSNGLSSVFSIKA